MPHESDRPETPETVVLTGDEPAARRAGDPDPAAATSLLDPRAVQILTAEHGSLLSARSLAYNEAFSRVGTFLAFLSMAFVALALVAQVVPIGPDLLAVTALVLAFSLAIGLTTYGRVMAASYEDYRAVHGMARIRHGYVEVAPVILPYLIDSIHDDLPGVMVSYGSPPTRGAGAILYGLTTSAGTLALILAMMSGVLALVVALALAWPITASSVLALVVGVATLATIVAWSFRYYGRVQRTLRVAFPSAPGHDPSGESQSVR
jgi:hypothetical protein